MRGQISLDFILAITIALIAAGAILAVSGQIAQTQAQASARQQLDGIGNGLAAIISTSALLNEGDSGTDITFGIPSLLIAGEKDPKPCAISINAGNGTILLSYEILDTETGQSEQVNVEKRFVNPAGMTVPASAECGKEIQITKA